MFGMHVRHDVLRKEEIMIIDRRYQPIIQRIIQSLTIIRHFTIIAILALSICSLIGLGTLFGSSSKASNENNYKYYTSIEIKNGDTLWNIASEYITEEYASLQEYVTEVKCLNGMQGDSIRSGQFLIIPYYSSELK